MKYLPRTKREVMAALIGWGVGYVLLAFIVGGYFFIRARRLQTGNCVQSAPPLTEGVRAWLFKGPSAVYLCVRLVQNGQSLDLVSWGETDAEVTGSFRYRGKDGLEESETLRGGENDGGTLRFPLFAWEQVMEGTPVEIEVRVALDSGEEYSAQVRYFPPFTPFLAYP